ncbi:hypothetical protein [Streptomyces lavendulae]|uniref:hypothetical protein n=1 Tax=Streptomyces lavendulae TaxID=1914 RepID=UPI0024A5F0FA|nr:hypothetical protein [Streptomyces lavendulae]GLV97024.1 hypothetical protein Slala05_06560 [Streptomyces lavendulae subsp. lavendulae]
MSYNQPGPYGQQPQQPGPYGQQPPPPPGPYGQPAPQPGYGYPQQTPPPPGYPQQSPPPPPAFPQQGGYQQQPPQPAYGYQQPPQQGYMPPPQPPKKSKAGAVIAVVLVVAVIGGAGWWFLGGGSGGSVSDATKGYKLVAPESVDDFKKDPKYQDKPLTDKDRQELEAVGIKNPTRVGMDYVSGDPKNLLTAKGLNFQGLYGDLADPEKSVDAYFATAKLKAGEDKSASVELIGSPKAVTPSGFSGAVMKCQEMKFSFKTSTNPKAPKEMTAPICIWGDYSTLGMVSASDVASIMANKPGYTLEQTADLAAKVYKTSRVKK